MLSKKIADNDILWLLTEIIDSFHSETRVRKGIPLGNLTSQVFANVYMNEMDQFVKQVLKVPYYLRYADDFVIIASDKDMLQRSLVPIAEFLKNTLRFELHPSKIIFRRLDWGIDFLGYILLPRYISPRTKTKNRIFVKLKNGRKFRFCQFNHRPPP